MTPTTSGHGLTTAQPAGRPARQGADRRFRLAGDPADRPPGARGGRLLRDRALPQGRGGLRGADAQGRDPVGRPGLGPGCGQPAGPAGDLRRRRAGARHLLRPEAMAHSSAARSRAATTASSAAPTSRSRPAARCSTACGTPGGRYPVWMSHGDAITALPEGSRSSASSENAPYAVIADEARHYYGLMFHPEVVHTPDGGRLIAQLPAQGRGPRVRLDHGGLPRGGDRRDPRPGRHRPGASAACRAASIRGGGRADPRGDRRPADLRLRRPRPAAPGRGRRRSSALFRDHYNIPLVHVDASRHVPRRARRRHRSRSRSARPSAGCSSTSSRPRPRRSAAPTSWRRARSTRT